MRSLRDEGFDPSGRRVVVLGAGGAGASDRPGAGRSGASVTVAARRREPPKPRQPSRQARPRSAWRTWATRWQPSEVVVNATPLGMQGERPPFAADALADCRFVYDTIYHPAETPAAGRGAAAAACRRERARDARAPGGAGVRGVHGRRGAARRDARRPPWSRCRASSPQAAVCWGSSSAPLLPIVDRAGARSTSALCGRRSRRCLRSLRTAGGIALVVGTGALFAALGLRFGDDWVLPAYLVLRRGARHAVGDRPAAVPLPEPDRVSAHGRVDRAAGARGARRRRRRSRSCARWRARSRRSSVFFVLHVVSPPRHGLRGREARRSCSACSSGGSESARPCSGLSWASLYGAVVGLVLLATRMRTRQDHVPFGPFLAAGALTARARR